ncbi:type II secretion system protein GspM [Zooshikella sp. RANM57]|uniref:type II secretion system protein GspM n=1 Tax=Zooshikella sp. RANM57 TaxID=3425863 RepID=UPI003D6DDB9F
MQAFLASLSSRDRRALILLSAFMGMMVLYWGIWQPTQQRFSKANEQLLYWQDAYQFVSSHQQQAKALQQVQHAPSLTADQARQRITQVARQQQLDIKRLEPGQKAMTLWLEQVPFQRVLTWLYDIVEKQKIPLLNVHISRKQENGLVDLRVSFQLTST